MTIKKKRTVVSALAAAFASAAMAITASAYTYGFSFSLGVSDQEYTAACTKNNTLSYASVAVTGGNFINSDRLYLRVCENYKADDYIYDFATETKWVNATYDFTLKYYSGQGVKGTRYRLRGYQDGEVGSLKASGTWQP